MGRDPEALRPHRGDGRARAGLFVVREGVRETAGAHRRVEAERFSDILDRIADRAENDPTPDSLTLGELIDAVGRRSYGPLLLFIGLFAISPITVIPGLTWVAAVLAVVVAGQMALGMGRIWLPKASLATPLPRTLVKRSAAASRKWARRIDAILKPRLLFMSQPPFVNLVALFCIGAALITFPLSFIPLAPLAPSLAVVVFGLGMAARDGLWLLAGNGRYWRRNLARKIDDFLSPLRP